jgi:hypothetical protein
MKTTKIKNQHYSYLKMIIRITTLVISIWALIVAYQAKNRADWVNDKQDNVVEMLMFRNTDLPQK